MSIDRQKILIVDDKEANLFSLEQILKEADADIIRAQSGNEALVASLNHNFAMALLDVQMPDMDGYELAEFLRGEEKTRALPIIFLTAFYSDEYHVFKGYEAGAVDFVTKPYQPEILLSKVRVFLQLDRQKRELQERIELEKQKSHLENILLSISDAVMVVTPKGRIQTVNAAALALLDYTPDEILGVSLVDLFEHRATALWKISGKTPLSLQDIDKAGPQNIETTVLTKNKNAIPVSISWSAFHDKESRLLGLVIVARDERERIKSRRALEASEEKYKNLYETSRDGIAFCDVNGAIQDANRAFVDMLGYELMELKAMNCRQLNSEQWPEIGTAALEKQILPKGYSDENKRAFTRKDGSALPVAARTWLSKDEAGNPNGIWVLIRDLTEVELLEQQRVMTEKMTALGMLAGGMSHELNNPIMGIYNFIDYCLKRTEKQDKRYDVLSDAKRETKRCMDLVKNLLTFSRVGKQSEDAYQWMDCEDIFDRVLRLLTYRIEKGGVQVVKKISEKSKKIYTRGNSMQQVFLNLMTNALDAVMDSPHREIRFEVRPDKEHTLISIRDSGSGVLPADMKLIFDPFFTTKPVGKGTGLGLSVSKGIIASHGGKLQFNSKPGKGSQVEILLPGKTDETERQEIEQ